MNKEKCLGCYGPLEIKLPGNYHTACSKKLFGTEIPPEIQFGLNELEELALKSLSRHMGVTGVQAKISTQLEKRENDPTHRLMIVDWEGSFILKPPTQKFPNIALIEDLTMHMAEACGLKVARHGLIALKSGELAYVTRRFDRPKKGKKIAVEDFCQLSELLTEDKYRSSTEKAGKIILKYAANVGLDSIQFFDSILFSYITGNSDMHLKNYSLLRNAAGQFELAPLYDLLATKLLLPEDKEETALTINGKKNKLKKEDFVALGTALKLGDKVIENSFARIGRSIPKMKELIERSFLKKSLQVKYCELVEARGRLYDLEKKR